MALIILPFAFWGVDSYTRSGKSEGAAYVNDMKISQNEFEFALRQQQARLRQQLGDNFDATMMNGPEMRRAVMDNLIAQRLLIDRARKENLVVTDDQIARVIGGIEAFRENGKFDKKKYVEVLSSQNMSPVIFESRLRDELLGQQVQEAYSQNGYVSESVVDRIIRLNEQQRVVSISQIPKKQFESQAKVEVEEIKNYYETNSEEFREGEQVRIEYVKLSVDDLMSKVSINKNELLDYYDQHLVEFGTPEERQAAHILISVNPDASQFDIDAAKSKAEKLLKQVKESPSKFAELARNNSQDSGSATNGGDLGFFGRGMMVKPFEDATFSLKVGEISDLVKSDFGYHIIKLLNVKPSRALSFDEVREGIANQLRLKKASDMFAELAEKFSNLVYEQSDTLKPAAELIGGEVKQLKEWLVKEGNFTEPWQSSIMPAVLSDEAIKDRRNTAAIEVAENTLVSARVLDYKPSAVRDFKLVQDLIRQKLLRKKSEELALKYGAELLDKLKSGNGGKLKWEPPQSITRAKYGKIDSAVVKQIFQVDTSNLPRYVGVLAGGEDFVIARIEAVLNGEIISDIKREQYKQQLRQLTGEEMSGAFMIQAKQQANIKVNMPEL